MSDAVEAFSAHAPGYDHERRRIVPCFEQFYGTAVTLLSLRPGPIERVLDLGTGTGLLAGEVLARHPDVQLVVLDGSAQMLEQARRRLPSSTETVLADLRAPLPDGPFDAVVSSLAIHHLEHDEQRDLYARIAQVLRPGGAFVNAEHVAGPTAWLEDAYRRLWKEAASAAGASGEELEAANERMLLNRCAPAGELLRWIDAAGLRDGDCFFKQLHFAVIAGWR